MKLSMYDNNTLEVASANLSRHVNNKNAFILRKANIEFDTKITGDLSQKIYRRSYYKNCIFDSTICKSIGFSGSKFIDTIFRNCDLENGNLHSCDFTNVTFSYCGEQLFKMKNVGFHKSTFTDCQFQNLLIFSCGFTDVIFYNVTFSNCIIKLSSFENAQFINCRFINVNLATLNLEYTEFNNIYATNTIFPFITIPVAFGLLQQLPLLDETNTVYSAEKEEHNLSIMEYLELLNDFECFYYHQKNYYGLANIYISLNRNMDAYDAINAGLLNNIKIRDYRMLYHFCRLVYLSNIFTMQQRRTLYENIILWITHEQLTLSEYHNYQLFVAPTRELLLNNDYSNPTLYFYLKTNINPNEIQKQAILQSMIENILLYCNVPLNSLELRHNSPYVEFLTVVCENFAQVSQVLIMIYSSLAGIGLFTTGIKNVIDSYQKMILNNDQHLSNKLEQEKLRLEISSIKQEQEYKERLNALEYNKFILELQKMNLDLDDMQNKAKSNSQILLKNDIEISVSHTSKNIQYAPIPEMIQYKQ